MAAGWSLAVRVQTELKWPPLSDLFLQQCSLSSQTEPLAEQGGALALPLCTQWVPELPKGCPNYREKCLDWIWDPNPKHIHQWKEWTTRKSPHPVGSHLLSSPPHQEINLPEPQFPL